MINKYRPSNSEEGEIFKEEYCYKCVREDEQNDVYCDILTRALVLTIKDAEYPEEWQYNKNDEPICTAFTRRINI